MYLSAILLFVIPIIGLVIFLLYLGREDKRKVIIYMDNKKISAKFKDLKKGDIFSLFEPNGLSVRYKNKHAIFKALSDAYLNEDGVGIIDCEPYKEDK